MAKKKVIFECLACGYQSPKWMGKCPNCGAWNQMEDTIEHKETKGPKNTFKSDVPAQNIEKLKDIKDEDTPRILTKINEFNRVLGGGVVEGSLVLIGGDPGIGKSTLLLQICAALSQQKNVLYVSGEESVRQTKLRAERLVEDS